MKFLLCKCLFKTSILVIILFSSLQATAQLINLSYNSTDAGNSFSGGYSWQNEKRELGLSLGFNINRDREIFDQNSIYHKTLHARKIHEFFAFKFFYHKNVYNKLENVKVFAFYDLQIRRSGTRNLFLYGYGFDSTLVKTKPEEGILYHEVYTSFGPYTWIENMLGLGLDVNLSPKLILRQKVGTGIVYILGKDQGSDIVNLTGRTWEMGALYNLGLSYRL